MRHSTRITVRDLPVMADIGINRDEIGRLQPLLISVCLSVDPVEDDLLTSTVDYRQIVGLAEMLARRRIGLIETFGTELARSCLAVDGVQHAEVTIDKPRALEAGIASVAVSMSRLAP